MKIVFDTNVLISAVATRGLCNELWELCIKQHELFTCEAILNECETKFVRKLKLPPKMVTQLLTYIKDKSVMIKPVELAKNICRDVKDLPILGAAVSAKADVLVSGDEDLLVIEKYCDTNIIRPRQLWNLLCSSSS